MESKQTEKKSNYIIIGNDRWKDIRRNGSMSG